MARNDSESKVREIRRKTRYRLRADEKIRMVLEGLRGEESIAALCRGDTKRAATTGEVSALRTENSQLKDRFCLSGGRSASRQSRGAPSTAGPVRTTS